MENKVDKIEEIVQAATSKLKSMEEIAVFLNDKYDDIQKDVAAVKESGKTVSKELGKLPKIVNDDAMQLNKLLRENKRLSEMLTDVRCRSLRDNLVFSGILESNGENTEAVLKGFIQSELEIETDISFEDVRRLGTKGGDRPRAILAKFTSSKQRDVIRRAGPKLRGKHYGINEHLPKEVMETRRKLMPAFRDAKRRNQNARFINDKLLVNGRRVRVEDVQSDSSNREEDMETNTRRSPRQNGNGGFRQNGSRGFRQNGIGGSRQNGSSGSRPNESSDSREERPRRP
ncbi:hypothetical protein FSP39_003450 [Pinctada imbricata]|uniref:Uncharacterized protein n=1 Tax=Pinctada imbricata TaxID=66713 RepID=A0AA89C428_PINIB|nr:hypothetical protein FSP39_003450 [Pinctada imbricata]